MLYFLNLTISRFILNLLNDELRDCTDCRRQSSELTYVNLAGLIG